MYEYVELVELKYMVVGVTFSGCDLSGCKLPVQLGTFPRYISVWFHLVQLTQMWFDKGKTIVKVN